MHRDIKFATLCSGIGAPEVAWSSLGWTPVFCAEIEPFASAVLAARFQHTPNLGTIVGLVPDAAVDVLIAGTPCQSFSVAGRRAGLGDPRGVLVFEFLRIVGHLRPRWFVWENVPGVLSSRHGRDFGAILGAVEKLGYGWAYRTLDAQFFGVPQRRRRVFVVGHLGDHRRAAAVLFERQSLSGDSAQGKKTRQTVTGTLGSRSTAGGGLGTDLETQGGCVSAVTAKWAKGSAGPAGDECQNLVTHSLCGGGHDASEDGTGRCVPIIFEPRVARNGRGAPETVCPPLKAESGQTGKGDSAPCVAIAIRTANTGANGHGIAENVSHTVDQAQGQAIAARSTVRRLTPRECERLQGFSDDYTLIDWGGKRKWFDYFDTVRYLIAAGFSMTEAAHLARTPDAPRYRAIGNSMAAPVIRWIGERIALVDSIC